MHQKHPPANVAIFVVSFMVEPPPSFLSSRDGAPHASPRGAHEIENAVKQARIIAAAEGFERSRHSRFPLEGNTMRIVELTSSMSAVFTAIAPGIANGNAVSGPGLRNIYDVLASARCIRVLAVFVTSYGAEANNLAGHR